MTHTQLIAMNGVGFVLTTIGGWISIKPAQMSNAEIEAECVPEWSPDGDAGQSDLRRQRTLTRLGFALVTLGATIQLIASGLG